MEANDASLGAGDATTRAQELRTSLGARQDVEAMLAEASKVRQDAAIAADALVEEAQQLSAQLVEESQHSADQLTTDARERADSVLSRARLEAEEVAERARATADAIRTTAEQDVEDHRRRVRSEVTAEVTRDLTEQHRREVAGARKQSEELISDLEASVRILGVSLESALSNLSALLGSLESLRTAADPSPGPEDRTAEVIEIAEVVQVPAVAAERVQPLDHLFGGPPAPHEDEASVEDPEHAPDDQQDDPAEGEHAVAGRPRSATEAFLSSSSLEVEQATRELRDLKQSDEARKRRSEESRRAAQRRELEDGLPDDDPGPTEGGRPLGWLFRTAQ